LYFEVNSAAVAFINSSASTQSMVASSLYDFLVGPPNLLIATASRKQVTLARWSAVRNPDQVRAALAGDGISLTFSNGHNFHLRLHTAEGTLKVSSPSLKWDTKSETQPTLVSRRAF
jgi:hypothetical protein